MKKPTRKLLSLLLFLAACTVLLLYLYNLTTTRVTSQDLYYDEFSDHGWQMTALRDGTECEITAEEAMYGNDTILLRQTVKESWAHYRRIHITNGRMVCVFVEEEPVYSNIPGNITAIQELPEITSPQISLYEKVFSMDPAWVGKTMTIVTRNYVDDPWISVTFTLHDDQVTYYQTIAQTHSHALPGAVFGVLALLFFGLFLYQLATDISLKPLPLLFLTGSALLQMLSYLSVPNTTSAFSAYQDTIQALYPLLPLLYLATKMKRYRKHFLACTFLTWGISFGAIVSWNVFYLPVPYWFDKLGYLSLVLVALMVIFAILCRRDGNSYFRRFLQLFGLVAIGAVLFTAGAALLQHPVYDTIRIYLMEAVNGYTGPLAFRIFTGVLLLLFYQALEELVDSRVQMTRDLEALHLRSELTIQSLETAKRTNEALAVSRHDQLHHFRTLASLCQEDPAKATAYIADVTKEIESIPVMRFTDHPLVNAILSLQAERAAKSGVRFTAKAVIPQVLPLPDKDLSTVLMNLMDNALDAAQKTPEGHPSFTDIRLTVEDDTLCITIENSLPYDFDPETLKGYLFKTTKKDTEFHGYGIRSARSVVSQYSGELVYHIQTDRVVLNTAMSFPN